MSAAALPQAEAVAYRWMITAAGNNSDNRSAMDDPHGRIVLA